MTLNGWLQSDVTKIEWCKFDQTLTDVRAGFADLPPADVEASIDQALIDARRFAP